MRKRAGAVQIFPAATASFLKSRPSYFRFARFNTFPLYYLRAWHRLVAGKPVDLRTTENKTRGLKITIPAL